MSAPEPTAEHIAEASAWLYRHFRHEQFTHGFVLDLAVALATAEARGFERGIEKAATVCEEMYAEWLAAPEIRGSTDRALNEYANMAREIRAFKEPR